MTADKPMGRPLEHLAAAEAHESFCQLPFHAHGAAEQVIQQIW
jgi:hypothetical protein